MGTTAVQTSTSIATTQRQQVQPNLQPGYAASQSQSHSLALQSAKLTAAYEATQSTLNLLQSQEAQRQLRVQVLLLEHDNDDLQTSLLAHEDAETSLEEVNADLRSELAQLDADLSQTLVELRARERETEQLRAEVGALSAVQNDLTKIVGEKMVLQRELAVLRPEIEHLRSNGSLQEGLLGEKLALQREISALQVELETEKRAVLRLKGVVERKDANRDGEKDAVVQGLNDEIEELKKELVKAQQEAQKNERENKKKAAELENTKEVTEGKLDAFRNKLRSTKEQLKEAQDEIEKMHAAAMAKSAEMTKTRLAATTIVGAQGVTTASVAKTIQPNPRKRNVARFDPDMTIGTPGHGAQAGKRQRTSVLPGEKSNFSMTPFLNKTMSILPESPLAEADEAEEPSQENVKVQKKAALDKISDIDGTIEDENDEAETENSQSALSFPAPKVTKTTSRKAGAGSKATKPKSQPLKETTNPKANAKSRAKAATASKASRVARPTLTRVLEEAENEEPAQDNAKEQDEDVPNPSPASTVASTKASKPAASITSQAPSVAPQPEPEGEPEETMASKLQSILATMTPEKPKQKSKAAAPAKKRTNIFDEDDGDDDGTDNVAVAGAAAVPKVKTLLKPLGLRGGLAGAVRLGSTGSAAGGAVAARKMLAEFSPLKRH